MTDNKCSLNDCRSTIEDVCDLECRLRAVTLAPNSTNADIRKAQLSDVDIKHILKWKEDSNVKPEWKELSSLSSAVKTYWVNWNMLQVKDGVLMKRWESNDGKEVNWKIVLPRLMRSTVLSELHNSKTSSHLGVNKLLHKVQYRYYWVGLAADVRSWVRQCTVCARVKNPPKKSRAPLQQYTVGAPLERVAMDILGPLPETDRGNRYVLVVGDYFTKWIEAYPLPNQEANTIARVLVEQFICRYGVPKELHSDQGRNFESNLMMEVCKLLGVKKTRTCPYHPRGDGFVERFNRTLTTMLTTMLDPERNQKDWDERVPYAMLAYRSAVQESTGESPSMMMLGRETTLPVDISISRPTEEETENKDYACELRERLHDTHEAAREKLKLATNRQAQNYDRNTLLTSFEVGEWVWLYGVQRKRGLSPKFMSKWTGPYLVISKLSDVVYRVQLKSRSTPKVIHIDRLKKYQGPKLRSWLEAPTIRRNPSRNRTKPRRYAEQ